MSTPAPVAQLLPGFRDQVADAQRVFRSVMQAMSRPGIPVPSPVQVVAPAPLAPEVAAILLALADYDTTLWLDPTLAEAEGVRAFLTFHTGAHFTTELARADYVVVADVATMPELAALKPGTPEYPDRSATLIVQVSALAGDGLQLEGPGIDGRIAFGFAGMRTTFADELRTNRALFPCGVDTIFAASGVIAALPRSARVVVKEG